MTVRQINDDISFNQAILSAGTSRLVVCDFFAHWCGPCRAIAPVFESLADRYSKQTFFLKIDVDQCHNTCRQYQVRAMPTFIVILNGTEISRVQGADPDSLERLIVDGISRIPGGSQESKNTGEHVANPVERKWLERFVPLTQKMQMYEDPVNQALALSLIPEEELRKSSTIDGNVNQYELAKGLLAWFHNFFTWVNQPKCEKCNIDTIPEGGGVPTAEEAQDEADRVEVYRCKKCSEQIRFPRYNNPTKLLETKKGRCGEYANCFALCCRAMGFQTRWVSDNLDHVWVEVYSDDLQRWLHCDPCENIIDTPLIYDKGWGKKHAYVFAFALDHIADVTWRYHFDHRAAMSRRSEVREPVLRNFINKLNARLAKTLTEQHVERIKKQQLRELIEFLTPHTQLRDGTEAQNQGRKSGAEEWKRARGEMK